MIELFKNDKSTVISIVPFAICEFKPGLYPGTFPVEACMDENKPTRRVITASEHIMPVTERKEGMRVMQPSFQVAESIVNDFFSGQLYMDTNARPGICWVPGDVAVDVFKTQYAVKYTEMKTMQRNWFINIVKKTDNEWTKYQNHRVASDQAKFAVNFLKLPTPPWMAAEEVGLQFGKCPACGTMNDPQNAICSNCKCVLDKKRFEALSFA